MLTCQSCGMPMDKAEDHGAGRPDNPYCKYCTDDQGNLLPRETVHQKMIDFFTKTMGKGPNEATIEVDKVMARMPAWRRRGPSVSAVSKPVMPEPASELSSAPKPPVPPTVTQNEPISSVPPVPEVKTVEPTPVEPKKPIAEFSSEPTGPMADSVQPEEKPTI